MNYQQFKNLGKPKLRQIPSIIIFGLSMLGMKELQAQPSKPTSCVLAGADSVMAGSVASYALNSCTASAWTVSCGQITDQKPGTVTINFSTSGCTSLIITATNNGKSVATKNVKVIGAPLLSPGSIASNTQSVNYGRAPKLLIVQGATGGMCGGSYLYQWFSSSDNNKFTPIIGATAKDYQPSPLTVTTYFKRQASCPASLTGVMTNTMMVTVYPALSLPKLNPSTQSINAHESLASISLGPLTGGGGNLRYQWQSSSSGSFMTPVPISGAILSSYTPLDLNATTFFRVAVINNGDTTYSVPAVVEVYPPVNAGMISPASQTLEYDSIPVLLSSMTVSGGDGKYTYQWYCSTDNNTWTLIPGVTTPAYNPGGLHVTTWFRVAIMDNGLSFSSNAAVINVNGQISTAGQ